MPGRVKVTYKSSEQKWSEENTKHLESDLYRRAQDITHGLLLFLGVLSLNSDGGLELEVHVTT